MPGGSDLGRGPLPRVVLRSFRTRSHRTKPSGQRRTYYEVSNSAQNSNSIILSRPDAALPNYRTQSAGSQSTAGWGLCGRQLPQKDKRHYLALPAAVTIPRLVSFLSGATPSEASTRRVGAGALLAPSLIPQHSQGNTATGAAALLNNTAGSTTLPPEHLHLVNNIAGDH